MWDSNLWLMMDSMAVPGHALVSLRRRRCHNRPLPSGRVCWLSQAVPMFLRKRGFHDVARNDNRSLQFCLGILFTITSRARQFCYRPPALQDHHPLTSLMDPVENGEASRFEVGCVDLVHVTSIYD